jgi:hypothetical protein
MRSTAGVIAAILCVVGVTFAVRARAHSENQSSQATATPVLVELFTSEGCSDCPPADTVLARLVDEQPVAGAAVVALGEHVDYWDQLGWKDRFSSAALTNRQQVYGAHFNLDSVYTPQMVVDGRLQFVGSDANAARKAIEKAAAAAHGTLAIAVESVSPRAVAVAVTGAELPRAGRGDVAQIQVAVIEDHATTEVKRGENRGKTLTHTAVVRSMQSVGEIHADGSATAHAEIALGADWPRDRLKVVAFVQEQRGRTVLASASAPLQTGSR